jgi:putative oxidoreductase
MTQDSDVGVARFAPYFLALLRIVAAALFLEHGLIKLAGFPAGAAPGAQPLATLLGLAAVIETVTGVLLILGLFTRSAAFVASGQMAVAYWLAHAPQGLYPAANGGEAAILFCFVFLYVFFAGPGALSLDRLQQKPSPAKRLSEA